MWDSHRLRSAATVCLLVLASCKVGPDYVPPETKMPDAWTEEMRSGVVQGPTALADWWKKFDDPVLSDLILVLRDNRLPGAGHGRPLGGGGDEFWVLDHNYPQFDN